MRALRRLFGFLILVGVAFAGLVVYRRRFASRRERVDLYYEDGSLVSLEQGADGAAECSRSPPTSSAPRADRGRMDDPELLAAIREHAYLEGDFVLRSGRRSSYYLDKYRFETRPDLLAALAERIAVRVAEVEPDAVRLAGPELGAVALAAATSLRSGLPFLIVRKAEKDYGTANRLEGAFEPGDRVCLIEDVVTSGGAAADAVEALRAAGLECRNAVCVVDREEGGIDALARLAVRMWPLFAAADVAGAGKPPQKPHG